jgi:hypothetical protein
MGVLADNVYTPLKQLRPIRTLRVIFCIQIPLLQLAGGSDFVYISMAAAAFLVELLYTVDRI